MRTRVAVIALLGLGCGGGELTKRLPDETPPVPVIAYPPVARGIRPEASPTSTGTTPTPPGPPPPTGPLCDPEHPYVCDQFTLRVCNPNDGSLVDVAVCSLGCSADRGECDVCTPGTTTDDPSYDPFAGCIDAHTKSICNDARDGFGKAEPCPETAKNCFLGVCTGCKVNADCPASPSTPCSVGTCVQGSCTPAPAAKGKAVTSATTFCDAVSCDGNGGLAHSYTPEFTVVPGIPGSPCTVVVCDGKGKPRVDAKPAGVPVPLGPTTDCLVTLCDGNGNAVPSPAPAGTIDPKGPSGECLVTACDGTGASVPVPSPAGTPLAPTDPCVVRACDATGGIDLSLAPPGTACNDDGQCDANGACVPCTTDADGTTTCGDTIACSSSDVPDAAGVYVATDGDDAAAGTPDAPVATIGAALAKLPAGTGAANVYVALGDYAGATAIGELPRAVVIDGGWTHAGAAWTRACSDRARVTTSASDAPGTPVIRVASSLPVTLRALRVETKDASSSVAAPEHDGESVVGIVFAKATTPAAHRLLAVEIIAHGAGAGGVGGPGEPGIGAVCDVTSACGTGVNGANGPDAPPPAPSESFSPDGAYTPAAAPAGAPGIDGDDGVPGMTQNLACWTGVCSLVGSGGLSACVWTTPPKVELTTQAPGPCGCGGKAGLGGRGGHRGGASLGIVIADTTVSVLARGTKITAGVGGTGGTGGPGGKPAFGSSGAPGASVGCGITTTCDKNECYDPVPDCVTNPFGGCEDTTQWKIVTGEAGPSGGIGGKGGRGADAPGGPSIAVAVHTGAAFLTTASTVAVQGAGGPGAGAAPAGPSVAILSY
jgi:hypothetical protein